MKKIAVLAFLICYIPIIVSSQEETIVTETMCYEPNYTLEQLNEFKKKVVAKGDKDSYNALLYLSPSYDRLPYSIIMAQRYGNKLANYMVYVEMTDMYKAIGVQMDSITIQFVLDNLKIAADYGMSFADAEMARRYLYGQDVQQDTIKAKEYFLRSLTNPRWDDQRKELIWKRQVKDYNRKMLAPK